MVNYAESANHCFTVLLLSAWRRQNWLPFLCFSMPHPHHPRNAMPRHPLKCHATITAQAASVSVWSVTTLQSRTTLRHWLSFPNGVGQVPNHPKAHWGNSWHRFGSGLERHPIRTSLFHSQQPKANSYLGDPSAIFLLSQWKIKAQPK